MQYDDDGKPPRKSYHHTEGEKCLQALEACLLKHGAKILACEEDGR